MPQTLTVRPGRTDEAAKLATVIATAFSPLPPTRWLLPDTHTHGRLLPPYFQILVDHALAIGHVDVLASARTDRPAAVAVWWDSHSPEPADYDQRLAETFTPEQIRRFIAFDKLTHAAHPDTRHHYLALLAVTPKLQRGGLGSMLLRHRHRRLDHTGTPGFLLAASGDARRLYHRHGYADHAVPAALPNGRAMWPMRRPPAEDAR